MLSTVRRVLVYSVVTDLLIVVAFIPFNPTKILDITPWQLLLIGIGEAGIAAAQGLVYVLPSRILSPRPSVKTVVAATVMLKLTLILPVGMLTSLYLISESLVVASIRGVSIWIGLLMIPVVLPYVLAFGLRRRLLVGLLSILAIVATRGALVFVVSSQGIIAPSVVRFSLMYDPIGAELSKLDVEDGSHFTDLSSLLNAHLELLSTGAQFESALASIDEIRRDLTSRVQVARSHDELRVENAAFETTKRVLRLYHELIDSIERLTKPRIPRKMESVRDVDDVASGIDEALRAAGDLMDADERFSTLYFGELIARYRLMRIPLIVFPIRPAEGPDAQEGVSGGHRRSPG